ncbi:GNAT family N-acetyltransferase [Chromobacterium sinusclupearum]|uniref:GNAT family N-acetyltransferase n=1 Tax=Chromobacterium sinusclupearum TaxID=2077146 RepID=A0A2K4MNE1_9NEIS|nr:MULTISPECIES: GNAT family N-acetyltransferase [Chromobacterium]POA98285.1 GNAT family N-acetyltransferase [Chromobacterium sinusclupearum]
MPASIAIATPESVSDWLPLFTAYLGFYRVSHPAEACQDYLSERLRRRQAVAFIASENERPQGFALLYTGFSSLTLKPCWVLHDLYVAQEARGSGIGELLIQRCQQYARDLGGGEIMLQTAHDNQTAQQLYERTGFTLDRDFRVYYWNSEHP